ncbi:MAG: TonB-dependent siderophore receptor [Acidobacteria bacterium]|nr:TonB-dependent siderophore receptor [Acidobacteriota bacterium]
MTKTFLRSALYLALAAAVPAGSLLAQDPESDPQEEQVLQGEATEYIFVEGSMPLVPSTNSIASKLPLSLFLTPNNIGMVTSELMREQNARVMSDALGNVSGINVQPGFGVTDYFVVRGFDSLSSGLVLTDGAPEPEATFWQLYNVELVEVLKGPGGFLYGSNPLAGTVNLVRKQPFAAQRIAGGAAFGSYSDFEGVLDYNFGRPDSDVAYRFNGLYRTSDGYRDNKDSKVAAFNPSMSWQVEDDHRINASFEYVSAEYSPDAGIPLLFTGVDANRSPIYAVSPVDPKNDYNSQFDKSDQSIYRFQVDYEGALSDRVTVRNKFYYRSLDWLSDGTLINGAQPEFGPAGIQDYTVFRTFIALDDKQDFLGNQAEAIFTFDTGSVSHNLLTGVEFGRYADNFTLDVAFLAPISLFNPVNPPIDPQPIPGQSSAGDARSIVFAPYVIDQISFSDRFQVLAGARFDSIDFKDDLTNRERSDSEVSPMFGAVWLPTNDVSVYGNYSRSFAPPSPRAFGDLEPEKSRQVEFGVKARWLDGRAQATAAVYELERENIAIPDDNGFTQQIGNQRSRGFELEMAFEPGSGFRAVGSYAYNDSELTQFAESVLIPTPFGFVPVVIDRSGNRPAFAPEHLFSVWGTKTFRSGLGISLGGQYASEQFIAEDNAFAINGAFRLQAAASYSWSNYTLSLNAQNLTGTDYFTRGFGSQSVIPAGQAAAWVRLGVGF